MAALVRPFKLPAKVLPFSPYLLRFYCVDQSSSIRDDDPNELLLESVAEQCKLGFINVHTPVSLFHQMLSMRPLPRVFHFNNLMSAVLKLKQYQPHSTVLSLFNLLQKSGVHPNKYTLAILAYCCSHLDFLLLTQSVLAKFIMLGYPYNKPFFFNNLLNGLVHNKHRLPLAFELLDKFISIGFQPCIITYAIIIKGLRDIGDLSGSLRLFSMMKSGQGIPKPDSYIYNTIIDGLFKHRFMSEALYLFSEMEDGGGIQPNVVTFSTLMNGYIKFSDINKALRLFQELDHNGIAPDAYTFNTLIDGLYKANRIQETRKMFKEMLIRGVAPNVVTYASLLHGLCKRGQIEEAMHMLTEMEKSGVFPNMFIYTILIDTLCKADKLEDASNLFFDAQLNGLQPECITYNIMIRGFCKAGLICEAVGLMRNMEENRCLPDERCYNTIIKGLILNEELPTALSYCEIMASKGFEADIDTLSLFAGLLSSNILSESSRDLLQKVFKGPPSSCQWPYRSSEAQAYC